MEEHRRFKFSMSEYLDTVVSAVTPTLRYKSRDSGSDLFTNECVYGEILHSFTHSGCLQYWEAGYNRRLMIQFLADFGARRFLTYLINPYCRTYGYQSLYYGFNPLYSKISADVDRFDIINYMSQYGGASIEKLVSHSRDKVKEYLVKGIYQ